MEEGGEVVKAVTTLWTIVQQLDDTLVPVRGGVRQRRLTVIILCIDIGLRREQLLSKVTGIEKVEFDYYPAFRRQWGHLIAA